MFSNQFLALFFLLVPFCPIRAAPTPFLGLGSSSNSLATTPVSDATVTSNLLQPALFSRIAYCSSAAVTSLTCGPPCAALPGVKILQTGGGTSLLNNYFCSGDRSLTGIMYLRW